FLQSYTSWVPSIHCFLACIFCRVLDASIIQFIDSVLMALQYQGTAAGGTTEIVLDGSTGLLHPAGKEGVTPLAKNMVRLASHVEQRVSMGNKGYARVKERFMEHHMAERIAVVLKEVLHKSRQHPHS
uniref:Glycosyl transferase family 1 domain-containing protein n=1 Tax=Aegilops tauschii subsp. strangulata TaxID=200361 RepID=A0A453ENL4_AEGTS